MSTSLIHVNGNNAARVSGIRQYICIKDYSFV